MNEQALQREIEVEREQLQFLRNLREKAEASIAAVEKQLAVNIGLLQRKQGYAQCEICHVVRQGKENRAGAFICSVCSGPSPLRRANR